MNLQLMRAVSLFNFIFFIISIGVSIYLVVLAIKLARRGIRALDIYINKNRGFYGKNNNNNDNNNNNNNFK